MAADSVNRLTLNLVHGKDRYDVRLELPTEEAGDVLTVDHLAKQVQKLTGVPVQKQKIIFTGRSLTEPHLDLKGLGLKNGSKIMLIGKKFNPEEDGQMAQMKIIEAKCDATDKKLSDIIYEVDGIHRGYMEKSLQSDALKKLTKRLMACTEEFTKELEELDALSLTQSIDDVKTKRKTIVAKVQGFLNQCDGIQTGLNEMIDRLI